MLTLVRGGELHGPWPLGRRDVLLADERILHVDDHIEPPTGIGPVTTIEASGHLVVPGFVDGHVHLLGGGGEGGFATRTPEIEFTDLSMAGVTTAIGLLGTDDVTRSLPALLATARGLVAEGLSVAVMTGSYRVPPVTLTGDVTGDIVLIPEVIGVGEVAIADHRGSQPTLAEFAGLAAASRRGGLLSGKGGVVTVHLGDGSECFDFLDAVVARTPLPRRLFLPTHVGRHGTLFEAATRWALAGGLVDLTTSTTPEILASGETAASAGLAELLADGVPPERVSFSSDGQGSMPAFDDAGNYTGLQVGSVASLHQSFRDAVLEEDVPLEHALRAITANPAQVHGMRTKGVIEVGADADLVLLDADDLHIRGVVARGQLLVENGVPLVRGTFDRSE